MGEWDGDWRDGDGWSDWGPPFPQGPECGCGFRTERRRRMRRGDTLQFQVTVLQNVQTGEYGSAWPGEPFPPNCVAVNLTGWRVIFTAKYEFPDWDSQAVAQLDNQTLGGVIASGTGGLVQVTMGPLATVSFADGPTR